MLGYLLRRLATTIPTLLIVAVAVFLLVRLIPGDPVQVMLGDAADPAQVAVLKQQLGLDRPLPIQFLYWLERLAVGDLGHSITNGLPVLPLILERFQVSAVIVLVAVAIAACIAVPAGLVAAWRQNSAVDLVIVGGATLLLSIPSFWLGLLLLLLFGLKLKWLPVVGYVPFSESFAGAALFMVLPVATLAMIEVGVLTRMARAASIEVLRLEYVTHARAKGVPEWRVLARHVLPNAFAPTWTLIGLVLGHLLGGIAVIETVFTLPGLGRLLVDSIFARDYPVVQGCLLFTALIYVLVNLIVDLCYPLFDPRVAVA
ncbi:peptide ABC transporter [Bradyrhizobium sp. SSBR45G]|uniref:ABC transporter permease n=1 Tax=unclassified Bradyrhizobium TaxID=2631580 RepID=UPI002342A503|nr:MULTISPECIES: ABC transporter permease [unclassified Bradyrhizobium]GLH79847.1 peptide ABC transporter [Bradyrhizobium sp. SSBR45G]GLH87223.1 peptide ABC transporter [Bradyrhizobium sp. SSBR45R]